MIHMHQNSQVGDQDIGRRDVLRGIALFLGVLGAGGAMDGCTPTPSDPQLDLWSEPGSILHNAWRPPQEMIDLGGQVLKERSTLLDETMTALTSKIQEVGQAQSQNLQGSSTGIKGPSAEFLSRRLYDLHVKSTRDGHWVEVQGWRLSAVEAAAYALIALNDRA